MPNIKPPNTNEPPGTQHWMDWFSSVYVALVGPVKLSRYTVATVPDATKNEGGIIYVSNEAGGATVAFSDGIHWKRCQDLVIIS